jgi:hypothetical protein
MPEEKQHCCAELASKLGRPDYSEIYISPADWERYAPAGWYPGSTGPGYHEVETIYEDRNGGRYTTTCHPLTQCPYCGAHLTA